MRKQQHTKAKWLFYVAVTGWWKEHQCLRYGHSAPSCLVAAFCATLPWQFLLISTPEQAAPPLQVGCVGSKPSYTPLPETYKVQRR